MQVQYFGWLPSGEDNAVLFSFPKGEDTLTWTGQSTVRPLYTRLSHIPVGLVLYFGRSLVLNPNVILWIVMFGNHLLYSLIVYFALKRLNSGKYLMAAIAMVPLTFLVSAGLGYDGWMVSLFMLGFAYFFYELQTPDKKITLKSMIIIIGALLLGLVPRPIFVPLLLILYFIRKDKFKTGKEHKLYLAAVTSAILFVLINIAIPYFATGGSDYNDPRGDGNVSITAQIAFILQNPLTYTGILLNFLKNYVNIFMSERFISWYISYDYLSFPMLTILAILFIALTDRREQDRYTSSIWSKILITAVVFSTIVLFTTAMYISFTSVGAPYILGVQRRYLIPLLFPFFYIICNLNIIYKLNSKIYAGICKLNLEKKINEATYSILIFSIMTLVLFNGLWNTFLISLR